MPKPEFTSDETYLINCVKSPKAASESSSYMWGYVSGALIIAGFALYYESIPLLLCSLVVVCGFRIYEHFYQKKWTPVWRSVIFKFETAVMNQTDSSTEVDAKP